MAWTHTGKHTQKVVFFFHTEKAKKSKSCWFCLASHPKKVSFLYRRVSSFLLPRIKKIYHKQSNRGSNQFPIAILFNLTPKRTRWLVSNIFSKLSSPKKLTWQRNITIFKSRSMYIYIFIHGLEFSSKNNQK